MYSIALVYATLLIAQIIGWFGNLFDVIGQVGGPVSTQFILGVVGIFIPPVGAINYFFF